MKQNQNTIAAIDHKRANSWPFLTFSSVAKKNWPFSRGYFGRSWGHALVAVAVVERWPFVEVWLYLDLILLPTHTSFQKIPDPREVGNFSNENEI